MKNLTRTSQHFVLTFGFILYTYYERTIKLSVFGLDHFFNHSTQVLGIALLANWFVVVSWSFEFYSWSPKDESHIFPSP